MALNPNQRQHQQRELYNYGGQNAGLGVVSLAENQGPTEYWTSSASTPDSSNINTLQSALLPTSVALFSALSLQRTARATPY